MKAALWLLTRQAQRAGVQLGWLGMAGVALLLAAVLVYVLGPLQDLARLRQMESDTEHLRERIVQAARGNAPVGTQAQLNEFYGFFARNPSTEWLNKIYAAAAKQHLSLEQGEYRLVPDKTGKLMRYQLTLPVKGSYVQLRQFIGTVLRDVPVAALDDITFKRETIGSTVLEARLKFTLFLGAQ